MKDINFIKLLSLVILPLITLPAYSSWYVSQVVEVTSRGVDAKYLYIRTENNPNPAE